MATSVNLADLLGATALLASGKECVQLAGDDPEPNPGGWYTHDLAKGKHEVIVTYKDMFLTADVYLSNRGVTEVYLYCPRCRKQLRVGADRKSIDFSPEAPNPQMAKIVASGRSDLLAHAYFGRLSIDTFSCTWEMGDAPHTPGAKPSESSLCRLRLVIDDNRAVDA